MNTKAREHSILDSLATAVIVLNQDLTISYINASAEEILGVSGEHLLNRSLAHCFSSEFGTPQSLNEALQENRHFTKRRARWKLHNNQTITLDYTVTPFADLGTITIEIQPLDRLLRISREEAWLSSQETSRNLVRSMAHEIKNPLGGIRGAAQLLSRELIDNELEEYTQIIIDETDRLRNLVDRMLGPRVPPKFEKTNVHHVLERVISVISLEAGDKVSLTRNYDPSIPEFYGDLEQLIQAVLNIVRNAMQALLENSNQVEPEIVLSTRIQRRYTIGRMHHPLVVMVSITDNGPGIPPQLIEDIFFPMITGRAEGSGLGLSISQNLIGQHNGLIECNSEPGWTEFTIYLPLGNSNE